MYCGKCGKIVWNRADLCPDCAASRITLSQSVLGDTAQSRRKQDYAGDFGAYARTSFSKNNMDDQKNTFKVEPKFSCCEWFVMIFGSILLGIYIFSNSVLLSGLTGTTIFVSILMFIIFGFCGFACISFPLVESGACCRCRSLNIKGRMIFKLYHDHLFQNVITAKETGDSLCKLLVMANGALIFIFCLVLSAISLFANIDYGYGHLNFLNAVLFFLFFLNLGVLYLSFSFVLVEASPNTQTGNKRYSS